MKAIVYTSQSGFTKQYAELLSSDTGLPAYNMKSAKSALAKNDEIVYLGWLMGGFIKGYKKAAKRYAVKVACAVGMGVPGTQTPETLMKQNHISGIPVFYLQGGFDINKLHGINKLMMRAMTKALNNKPDKTPEEVEMVNMSVNGGNRVSRENLTEVLAVIKP